MGRNVGVVLENVGSPLFFVLAPKQTGRLVRKANNLGKKHNMSALISEDCR